MIHVDEEELDAARNLLIRIKKQDQSLAPEEVVDVFQRLGFDVGGEAWDELDVVMAFIFGAMVNESRDHDWYQHIVTYDIVESDDDDE